MNRYSYSPFRGPLSELAPSELTVLKEVSEGWYVEYKESPPAIKDLARHLSAFANQHGGFLFLGIIEDTANGMVAGSFPGVETITVSQVLVQLREASSAHVTPEVVFETRVIEGPVPEIGLSVDRSIVIVAIPESDNTPHVHSSGRIYRRVADHSDPKPETDRHVLDRLWERRAVAKQRLVDFLSSAPELAEGRQSHIFVYLLPSRTIVDGFSGLTYESFAKLMTTPDPGSQFSFTHNNVFPVSGGYMSRDTLHNDPGGEVPSFRWWFDGRVRATIPINTSVGAEALPSYQTLDRFKEVLRTTIRGFYPVGDLSLCLATLTCVISKYIELRKTLGWTAPFYGAVQMRGMLRVIPFINTVFYLEQIDTWSLPLIQNDYFSWPPEPDPASLVELIESDPLPPEAELTRSLLTAVPLLIAILRPMGIDIDLQGRQEHVEQVVSAAFEATQLEQGRAGKP